jgi:glycosyltransferase involved in cell wall biosynthesis
MTSCNVSIVVPVYNAERYIHKCLDSIAAQTVTLFEVVLIDDGSTDNSGRICDEYAAKDNRFRVIHQANSGVSASRQRGVDSAIGEYVIHVDSDDWIEPSMIELLYAKAKEGDYDMVICDYYVERFGKTQYIRQDFENATGMALQRKFMLQQLHGSCWNKLIRRTCYFLPDICFPKGVNIYEDLYVTCRLLRHDIRVGYLPKAFYHYWMGYSSDTLSMRITPLSVQEKMRFVEMVEKRPFTDDPKELYYHKKEVLFDLFVLKQYQTLAHTYSEIKDEIRNKNISFHLFASNNYVLKQALCGHIVKARCCYLLSLWAIRMKDSVKRIKCKIEE